MTDEQLQAFYEDLFSTEEFQERYIEALTFFFKYGYLALDWTDEDRWPSG